MAHDNVSELVAAPCFKGGDFTARQGVHETVAMTDLKIKGNYEILILS